MDELTLDEWLEIADEAMKKAWFPWHLDPYSVRGISASLLASFTLLLKEHGFLITKEATDVQ